MTQNISIRPARPEDDDTLAEAFYKMWLDNGMTDADFIPDWKAATLSFMTETSHNNQGRAFVADNGGRIVGAAQCLISRKLYPQALKPDVRLDGYIWGVYVAPDHRRQGLAKQLTEACVGYLDNIGCTRVVLHASESGKPVYTALGFGSTNEMRRVLA
ncbi:MAG: GNAT family N-acetyltransferase [Rhodospirillaceae bacterium]|jgi:ribosomal protein S18 acetylase RimI-like enzyme|nr:GNAT family N-acetyltransferase [Rhodospirillaceae bacterium]MBT5565804.1 GNAT family N-acetyltransferase [Rhodospirillaceae bacterium]MBT6090303.1 GNAT family N-acetyltransferase [Rhodospirillaceae bacterium]MBT6961706.1 GNAT family N-acetyltransferase [Rhodospirillaceae bacterium]